MWQDMQDATWYIFMKLFLMSPKNISRCHTLSDCFPSQFGLFKVRVVTDYVPRSGHCLSFSLDSSAPRSLSVSLSSSLIVGSIV